MLNHRHFQCIFTALAKSKPEDPNKFILSKLREYQEGKHFDLSWDSFIMRKDLPTERVFKRTFIENFFTLEDLAALVSYKFCQFLMNSSHIVCVNLTESYCLRQSEDEAMRFVTEFQFNNSLGEILTCRRLQ